LDVDGKIDRVQLSFSEPVSHAGSPPVAIGVQDHTVSQVSVASGDLLTASVAEQSGQPNGGFKPSVSVLRPDLITDAASPANQARSTTFTATTDGVRPVLLSAQLGERSGSSCLTGPVNGRLDCFRGVWSEAVQQPSGAGALSIGGYTISGLIAAGAGGELDVALAEQATPDRDRQTSVAYAVSATAPVVDLAGNESLAGGVTADRACPDESLSELVGDDDSQLPAEGNPEISDPVPVQRLCADDADWFRVTPQGGMVNLMVDPAISVAASVELRDSTGALVAPDTPSELGEADVITRTGLPDTTYWLRISAPTLQEGDYCVDLSFELGETCDDGDPLPS
jgi:hypothetical protein